MEYTILKKGDGYYLSTKSSDLPSGILGSFLQEVGNDSGKYKDWINDPEIPDIGNNLIYLEKEDGKAALRMEWAVEEADPAFIVTIDKLINIIDQWEKLYAQKPDEIVVYKEGDEFILKGRN